MGGEGFIQMSRYCSKIEPPASWSQTRNQSGKIPLQQDSLTKLDYPPFTKRIKGFSILFKNIHYNFNFFILTAFMIKEMIKITDSCLFM